MNPAIEIKNLSFSYGDTENQLKHINLSVEKGEVIVLTGPSGSGKSTLTRVINGLIPYFFTGELSGEVWLFGKNMAEIPSWERGKYVGNIILMITHDLECALATCSRALVIRDCTLADDFQIDNAERLMAAMRE